jgi:hypothetical protein
MMAKGYNTGGKHEPGGIPKHEERAGSPCDVGRMGAGMGTGYDQSRSVGEGVDVAPSLVVYSLFKGEPWLTSRI